MTKKAMSKTISIIKPKLAKQTDLFSKFLFSAFLILGLMISITDLKSGIIALVTNVIVIVFLKKLIFKWNLTLLILLSIAFKIVVCFCFEMENFIYILVSFFLFPLYFLKDIFTKYDAELLGSRSEVFYMDSKKIKCIHTVFPNKQYAMDPLSYLKILDIQEVKSISFDTRMMQIAYKDTILQPLELNKEDKGIIYEYVKTNFPELLNNPEIISNRKNENKFLIKFMMIILVVIICLLGEYILGENGANKSVTAIFSILIGIFSLWGLWEITRRQ